MKANIFCESVNLEFIRKNKDRGRGHMNSIKRNVTHFAVIFIGIFVGCAFLSAFAGGEGWVELVEFLLGNIPFSKWYSTFAANIISNAVGTTGNLFQEINSFTYMSVWQDLLKTVVTILLYEALNTFTEYLFGLRYDGRDETILISGGVSTVKRIINSVFCSIAAAALSIPALYLLFSQMSKISLNAQNIIAIITSGIVLVGAILVCYFLFGQLLSIFVFLFLRTILINLLIISVNYIFVFLVVFALHDKSTWSTILSAGSVWLVLMFLLAGIDIALDTVIKKE